MPLPLDSGTSVAQRIKSMPCREISEDPHQPRFYLHNHIGKRAVRFRIIRLVGQTNSLIVYHDGMNRVFRPLLNSAFMIALRKFGMQQGWTTLKQFASLHCEVTWPSNQARPTVVFILPKRRTQTGKSEVTKDGAASSTPTLTSPGEVNASN